MKTIKQLFTLTNRIVRQNLTSVDTIITSIVMPIFILLFRLCHWWQYFSRGHCRRAFRLS